MKSPLDAALLERLYRRANGGRWRAPLDAFAAAIDASLEHAAAGHRQDARAIEQYATSLHLEDLAIACACAAGVDKAWEHFVHEQRPLLYRAADAIDPSGGARDLADSLYADLFGLQDRGGERRSLFGYFHGRSSLTTWLRAVLAQRHVDRLRANRRLEALPDEESPAALASPAGPIEPDRGRFVGLMQRALERAMAALVSRDRLRLGLYYAQGLTLAEAGRMMGEHEATASRQLARTRRAIKDAIEHDLRSDARLTDAEIARCFECVAEDAGPLDLGRMLASGSGARSGS